MVNARLTNRVLKIQSELSQMTKFLCQADKFMNIYGNLWTNLDFNDSLRESVKDYANKLKSELPKVKARKAILEEDMNKLLDCLELMSAKTV